MKRINGSRILFWILSSLFSMCKTDLFHYLKIIRLRGLIAVLNMNLTITVLLNPYYVLRRQNMVWFLIFCSDPLVTYGLCSYPGLHRSVHRPSRPLTYFLIQVYIKPSDILY